MKVLVVFFSAEGRTAKVAKDFARHIEADVFEVKPKDPYSEADIRWTNPLARCNREKIGKKDVPVEGSIENFSDYDVIFLGFPIWYGGTPNVVNTFCKGYDWSGKKVYAFATSGGSGIGKTAEKLMPYVSGALSVEAKLVQSTDDLNMWSKKVLA